MYALILYVDEIIVKRLDDFFSNYKFQKYKKGELLIRADENPTGIFYLKKGIVKEYSISKKGDELVVNIFKSQAFFPMSWALNNTQNSYFFEATEDLELWKAPREDVIDFLQKNPNVTLDLLKRVYKGTDGMLIKIMYLMSGSAYARLITELLTHSKRFGGNGLVLDITEGDLASRTGMTRETISREMKILKDKNIVKIEKNKVMILNLTNLELELDGGI